MEFGRLTYANPVLQRQQLGDGKPYRYYKEALRADFWYSCAYCTMTELEAAGISFEIDHYLAQAKHPELATVYKNLMWSCRTCNGLKRDIWPDVQAVTCGVELYRPDQHDAYQFFDSDGVRLSPRNPSGRYTIEVLDLNRMSLQRIRSLRERRNYAIEQIIGGLRTLHRCRIDEIPPATRRWFVAELGHHTGALQAFDTRIAAVIRRLCQSTLIDPDPAAKDRAKARRAYLDNLGAVVPDPPRVSLRVSDTVRLALRGRSARRR